MHFVVVAEIDQNVTKRKKNLDTEVLEFRQQTPVHPRRARGKHKTKQKGQMTGKRNIGATIKR